MKILIVDDEPLIRRSLRRAFAAKSHTVFEAEDGIKGLAAWRENDPDVVVLDVLMPGLTGPQVLKEISLKRRAKVVLISAYTGEYDLKKAKDVGADLFIPKPFTNVFDFVTMVESLSH
jgi:two-component system, response regulator PdtaR